MWGEDGKSTLRAIGPQGQDATALRRIRSQCRTVSARNPQPSAEQAALGRAPAVLQGASRPGQTDSFAQMQTDAPHSIALPGPAPADGDRTPWEGAPGFGQWRIDPLTPLRARDFVGLGVDGHRWGIGGLGPRRRERNAAGVV